MSAAPARAGYERGSLLGRLAAWWSGVDATPSLEARSVEVEAPAPMPRAEVDLRSWSAERIEAAQLLYGEGWLSPGGEALYAELAQCLLLDANQTVVLHGAGLGGLARMIARDSEAWIEAQEANPLLSAEAVRLNKAAGLGKKVEVLNVPMEARRFKPRSRHAVVSCEALYRAPDKAAELATLCAALKPGGQLLLTDFVRKGAGADAVARWARCEAEEPHFIPADELKALLVAQGLGVRVFEDRSRDFCRRALADLQALLSAMESAPVRQSLRGWLIWEIEVLTQKLQALDSGAIGFQRVFAMARGQRVDR